jgi:hypothetical protein
VDPILLGLWYVCGLGAAAFGAAIPLRGRDVTVLATAAAAATTWASPGLLPTLPAAGLLAAAGAGFQLVRGTSAVLSAVLAGTFAGLWTGVLEAQGVPAVVSPIVALSVPIAAAMFATREGFAPAALRDETYLFVACLGIVTAAAPVVYDGWRAALDLNLQDTGPSAVMLPVWTFALGAMAALSGGAYALWSRR